MGVQSLGQEDPLEEGMAIHSSIIFYDLPLTILFFNSIFNWRITALQHCDGFCHTWTWISHMHKCVPSVLNLPHPIPQNCHRADIPMDRGAWWAIWLSYHWVVRFIGMLSPSRYWHMFLQIFSPHLWLVI